MEDRKTCAKIKEQSGVFSKNTLHTLFSHAELYLNGKLNSHSNNCYFHAAFIELTPTTDGKQTWTNCQGYDYLAKTSEQNQQFSEMYADFHRRKQCTTEFYGALHIDFLTARNFWCPASHFIYDFSVLPITRCFLWREAMTKPRRLMVKCKQLVRKLRFFLVK